MRTSVVSSPPVLTKSLSNMRSYRKILLREYCLLSRKSWNVLKPWVDVAGTFCSSQQISLLIDSIYSQTAIYLQGGAEKPHCQWKSKRCKIFFKIVYDMSYAATPQLMTTWRKTQHNQQPHNGQMSMSICIPAFTISFACSEKQIWKQMQTNCIFKCTDFNSSMQVNCVCWVYLRVNRIFEIFKHIKA